MRNLRFNGIRRVLRAPQPFEFSPIPTLCSSASLLPSLLCHYELSTVENLLCYRPTLRSHLCSVCSVLAHWIPFFYIGRVDPCLLSAVPKELDGGALSGVGPRAAG